MHLTKLLGYIPCRISPNYLSNTVRVALAIDKVRYSDSLVNSYISLQFFTAFALLIVD